MKWVCIGILVLLLILFLCLLLPVRYYFTFEKWKFFLHVDVPFGLWKKEIHVPKGKEDSAGGPPPEMQDGQEEPADAEKMAAVLEEAERSAAHEVPSGGEQKPDDESEAGHEQKTDKEPQSGGERIETEQGPTPAARSQLPEATTESLQSTDDATPSLFAQIRFAIRNGLAGRVFHGAWKLLLHSFPGHWEVTGTFGTGDPMDTAMVQGLFCAFLPGVADGVIWNYIEQADTLQGKGRGRIIPLYAAYIALTVLLSKEMREFWQFRKHSEKRKA